MNSPTDSEHQDVISRTRHYVHQQGLKTPIGPECLVVGLVRHLGKEKAIQTLIKAGISNPQALFCDKTTPAGETLPPVKPDPALAALLAGPLKPFMVGDMPPKDALDFLLTNEGVAARVDALLQRATPRPAVEEVLGLLTRNFLHGYELGKQRYAINPRTHVSDFAMGSNESFAQVMREFYKEQRESRLLLYRLPGGEDSVYEMNVRRFGILATDVLWCVTINSITQFSERDAINCRELAWAIDPALIHRSMSKILSATKTLVQEGLIKSRFDSDKIDLHSWFSATDDQLAALSKLVNSENMVDDLGVE